MSPKDPLVLRNTFLAENPTYSELEQEGDIKAIGKIEDIDLTENEVWLLQCPKGLDVKALEHEKLKIPGRTNLAGFEAVSVDFIEGKQQHSFAYRNRNGRYDLRLLPIRGTIVMRNRLKAADNITAERIEECCPPSKRVPLPSKIRVRHPLLGFDYEEKLNLNKDVTERLQEADKISTEILRDSLIKKISEKRKVIKGRETAGVQSFVIESEDDEDVQFVKEEIVEKKKKMKKRNHSESNPDENTKKQKKSKKSRKSDDEEVSKDLQWLQNL